MSPSAIATSAATSHHLKFQADFFRVRVNGANGPGIDCLATRGRALTMKLLKAIVRPDRVDAVREAVNASGVSGMTVTEVRGHG